MKYFTLLALVFCLASPAKSQPPVDTIRLFKDLAGEVTVPSNAVVFIVAWPEKGRWHRQDYALPYYTIKMDGWYADKTFEKPNGTFYYFDQQGKDSAHGMRLQDDGIDGGFYTLKNETIKASSAEVFEWHRKDSTLYFKKITDSLGNGSETIYQKDGKTIAVHGPLEKYLRSGEWQFKDSNGVLGVVANYKADSANTTNCYDQNGNLENKTSPCVIWKGAMIDGGAETWKHFLEQNLQYPKYAQRKEISGTVRVKFDVEIDGTLSHIEVMSSPHESLSKETLRIFSMSPKWIPAMQYNRLVKQKNIQGITFLLQ